MPRRRQYYDPFIQKATQEQEITPVELRGVAVEQTGTYILFEDMLAAIRQYAEMTQSVEIKDAILELVAWFEMGAQ